MNSPSWFSVESSNPTPLNKTRWGSTAALSAHFFQCVFVKYLLCNFQIHISAYDLLEYEVSSISYRRFMDFRDSIISLVTEFRVPSSRTLAALVGCRDVQTGRTNWSGRPRRHRTILTARTLNAPELDLFFERKEIEVDGSGLIARETSRAYDDIFAITLVTARSVGIGAYFVRLDNEFRVNLSFLLVHQR
ncbi:hypothetical protein BU17DRAFT_66124 [Hysterangium stoloniferum]|nr:hypothetical protein BU17DRAFT_66124 [Hysterangium stoloniferum]